MNRRRIALLVETSLGSGREILGGIGDYSQQVDRWQIYHEARDLHGGIPEWLEEWNGDGIIARVQTPAIVDYLKGFGLPVVDVLGILTGSGFPVVHVDDHAIAVKAGEHFIERGFTIFGYYGIAGENWSENRRDAFRATCEAFGRVYVHERARGSGSGSPRAREELRQWLRSLPKPVGIMVCSDQRALGLLEACREEGIAVPERVAIVSVDNDMTLCGLASPALSSVRAGHRSVGFEAARLLDTLIDGARAPAERTLVSSRGLVVRGSSDTQAIYDRHVAEGLHYIHEHLSSNLTNALIAKAAGISRTLFQRRFRKVMGKTIRSYVIEHRVQLALALLKKTDMTLAAIADRAGFTHAEYMGSVMKTQLGITPGRIRAGLRGGDPAVSDSYGNSSDI